MGWFLLCYFLVRPICTLLPELARVGVMLSWRGGHAVILHLGTLGHDRGWAFRVGRVSVRLHPLFFLMRGSMSDTDCLPRVGQYWAWNVVGLGVSLVLFGVAALLLLGDYVPGHWLPVVGMMGLLAFVDVGIGLFREFQPIPMRCGIVHTGAGSAMRDLVRYGDQAIVFLQGVRHYLRDDYYRALEAYEVVYGAGHRTEELLEDMMYAQMVLGQNRAAIETYGVMVESLVPNATQLTVVAQAYWGDGQPLVALQTLDRALGLAKAHPIALNYRAWMLLQGGAPAQVGQALKDLDKALGGSKEYAAAWANRAWGRWLVDDVGGALADVAEALKHDPIDLHVLEVAVMVYGGVGRLEEVAVYGERMRVIRGSQ